MQYLTSSRPTVTLAARWLGAAAVGATAGLHLHLWLLGYSGIPTIGPLFMLNAVGGALLVLALLAVPARGLGVVALAAAGYEAATVGALLLASTRGLFNFVETTHAPLYWESLVIESVGALILLALALAAHLSRRRPTTGSMVRSRLMPTMK